jgi:hypothetical protein
MEKHHEERNIRPKSDPCHQYNNVMDLKEHSHKKRC